MDASTSVRKCVWPQPASPDVEKLVRAVAVCLFALLTMAAMLLCVRRATGALTEPLPAMALLGWGGLLAIMARMFRNVFAPPPPRHRSRAYALWAAPSVVLALWAGGLSIPGSAGSGLVGLWGLLLLEEGWSWGRLRHELACLGQPVGVADRSGDVALVALPLGVAALGEVGQELDQAVSQQIVRRRQDDGREAMEGWVRAEVAPAQRHATAHVAICPPFTQLPECFAEQLDGPPARIKIAQVLHYGVRFEIKLDQPCAEASSVLVEFSIRESAADD